MRRNWRHRRRSCSVEKRPPAPPADRGTTRSSAARLPAENGLEIESPADHRRDRLVTLAERRRPAGLHDRDQPGMKLLDRRRNLGGGRGTPPSDPDSDDEHQPQEDTPAGRAQGHREFSYTRLSDFASERSLATRSAGTVNAVCGAGVMPYRRPKIGRRRRGREPLECGSYRVNAELADTVDRRHPTGGINLSRYASLPVSDNQTSPHPPRGGRHPLPRWRCRRGVFRCFSASGALVA